MTGDEGPTRQRRGVRTLALAVATGLAFACGAAGASADVVWLCKPGVTPDPCQESLATTTQQPDGSDTVTDPGLASARRFDCFYVYPTVSQQLTVNADKTKDPEEIAMARYQAARFSQHCRVFAPMYRQLTLPSIYTGTVAQREAGRRLAYGDVLEAWNDYLAHDNHGRGVVLMGHSQGSVILRALIRNEIENSPPERRLLISALLPGGTVLVRPGQTTGGDFTTIPLCTAAGQFGCVVSYSSFGDPPPGNARYGVSPPADTTGLDLPSGTQYEVACTNPTSLDANAESPLTTLLPSSAYPGLVGIALLVMFGGPPPTAATPWVQPRNRYTAHCEHSGPANVLMIRSIGSAPKLNPAPTPDWGLHILDTNLALGNLVALVDQQATAYAATPTALRVSPSTFKLTGSKVHGRCVKQSAKYSNQPRCKLPIKLHITYTLTAAAIVTFTLKHVRGAITRSGNTGVNTFTFNGHIGGHKLGPGSYRLTATTTGGSQRVKFRIAR
jgi:hypothetical protein